MIGAYVLVGIVIGLGLAICGLWPKVEDWLVDRLTRRHDRR